MASSRYTITVHTFTCDKCDVKLETVVRDDEVVGLPERPVNWIVVNVQGWDDAFRRGVNVLLCGDCSERTVASLPATVDSYLWPTE
jgi:hypothetical protein